jgi:DeoR/GlpR family transcriptional regulator of sugar metabolism
LHRPLRQAAIVRALRQQDTCRITELADQLQGSGGTIRRDIIKVAQDGLMRKLHGGAALADTMQEPSFSQRMSTNADAKQTMIDLLITDRPPPAAFAERFAPEMIVRVA